MAEDRIEVYSRLVQAIVSANAELLDSTHLQIGIERQVDQFPAVENIKIRDDFTVEAELPDEAESILALNAVIENVFKFVEILVGPDAAEERIRAAYEKFKAESGETLSSHGLEAYLPEVLGEDAGVDVLSELDDLQDHERAIKVFEALFSEYLRSRGENDRSGKLIDLKSLAGDSALDLSIDADEAWTASIDTDEEHVQSLVDGLSALFDECSGFSGLEPVETTAVKRLVVHTLDSFGDIPTMLGIRNRIMGGMLARRLGFGIPLIDDTIEGGILRSSSVLLQGPVCCEKYILANQFVKTGLETGGSVIVFLSTCSPDDFRREMSLLGIDTKGFEESGHLLMVDWYSFRERRIVGVEDEGSIIRASQDLTNVGIAVDMAMKRLKDAPTKRAVIRTISPPLQLYEFDSAYALFQSLRLKFRKYDITGLIIVEKEMHTSETLFSLKDTFDSVMELDRSRDGQDLSLYFIYSSYSGNADTGAISIKLTDAGMLFKSSASGSEHEPFLLAMEERDLVSTGIEDLDELLGGGVLSPSSTVIQGPASAEKEALAHNFIREGLENGEGVLVTVSGMSPGALRDMLNRMGVDVSLYESEGALVIVDWSTHRAERIIGVEEAGSVIRSSQDLSHLNIAVDMAIKALSGFERKRAVLDILSPAMKTFDFETVYGFGQSIRAKMTSGGVTSFFMVEKEMHHAQTLAAFQTLGNTVLDIEQVRTKGYITRSLAVLTHMGAPYISQYRSLTSKGGLASLKPLEQEAGEEESGAGPSEAEKRLGKKVEELEAQLVIARKEASVKTGKKGKKEESKLERELNDRERALREKVEEVKNLRAELKEMALQLEELDDLRSKVGELERKAKAEAEMSEEEEVTISEQREHLDKWSRELDERQALVEEREKGLAITTSALSMKERELEEMKERLQRTADSPEAAMTEEREFLERKKTALNIRQKVLDEQETRIKNILGGKVGADPKEIQALKVEIRASAGKIEELLSIVQILDDLLEALPEDKLDAFVKTKEYAKYEAAMDKFFPEG